MGLTHFDDSGASRMVSVGEKPITTRRAVASSAVTMLSATRDLIRDRRTAKGDVLEVARLAGIMGAKQTAQLIPLCHPLPLDSVAVEFCWDDDTADKVGRVRLRITATVSVTGRTGVEMEALTAAAVAGLTVYDMCKAVDRAMELGPTRLEAKSGGRSGDYLRGTE